MGASFFSFSFSMVSFSSLRSSLVPTRMMGVEGQWWRTSGYHWTENKMRNEEREQHKVKVCDGDGRGVTTERWKPGGTKRRTGESAWFLKVS